jgi:acylphosphatase
MDASRIHHFSLLLVGLSLGVNGWVTARADGVSALAGTAAAVGGTLMLGVSVYVLATGAESAVERRVAALTALAAMIAVSGVLLVLLT